MGPRSNASRKRKRATTSQALDLLNAVNSTNDQTRHSLPPISRQPKAPSPQHSRSDGIFDDPSSPQMVPNSQPLTPRRSTRLQQSSPADTTGARTSLQHIPNSQPFTPRRSIRLEQSSPANPTPTRRSLRHSASGQASHRSDATSHSPGMRDQAGPSEKDPGAFNMHINEGDENDNENAPSEEDNEFPRYPSPSVIVHQDFSRESVAQKPSHADNDSVGTDSPNKFQTPPPERRRESPRPRASLNPPKVGVQSAVGPSADVATTTSEKTAVAASKTPLSSPKKLRFAGMSSAERSHEEHPLAAKRGHAQNAAPGPGEDDSAHPNENESDAASDSDSRHTLRERDSSPVNPNRRRQLADRDDETCSPSDGSSQSDRAMQSQDESEDGDQGDFWFTEAQKLGGHKETWRSLLINIRKMKEAASSDREEKLKDITRLISRLKALYRDGIEYLRVSRRVPRRIDDQCRHILDRIQESGDILLSQVYFRVEAQKPSRADGKILTDFEGRVIANMVHSVLLPSFRIYYESQGRSEDRFNRVLKLLIHFVLRVYSLVVERKVSCRNRSRVMLGPLRLLLRALIKGELIKVSNSRPVTQHQHTRTEVSRRPWTDDEGKVLVAALRKYTGPGRYMIIIAKYGDRLRGRTPSELRAEARRIHDRLLPEIESSLHLPGMREQFRWLLSVASD